MNKKTIMTLGSLAATVICIGAIVAWGTYKILNIPAIKNGLQTASSEFSAMFDLREKILERYECPDVSVQLMNGNTLNISLINSDFNDLPASDRASKAYEVAVFVRENYTGKAEITRVVITFEQNNRIGPLNTNWAMSYPFEMSELR